MCILAASIDLFFKALLPFDSVSIEMTLNANIADRLSRPEMLRTRGVAFVPFVTFVLQ